MPALTKTRLINENTALRQRVAELENGLRPANRLRNSENARSRWQKMN
jgi:hypothetical protein